MSLKRHVIGNMRVIIEYDPWSRLGNRMFQYAFAYLLAKQFNCELLCNEGLPNFGITPNPVGKLQCNNIKARSLGLQHFDFDAVKDFDGDIIIDSYVQKSKYYLNDRQLLKDAFGIRELDPINKDALILHIRGADYKQVDCFLGYDFYKSLIHSTSFKKVKIVTDDPSCKTVSKLVSEGCELITDEPTPAFCVSANRSVLEDFKPLLYSENIYISQSSFSWWPAFLGDHKKIIFPYSLTKKQMWPLNPGEDDQDLFFDFNGNSNKYVT